MPDVAVDMQGLFEFGLVVDFQYQGFALLCLEHRNTTGACNAIHRPGQTALQHGAEIKRHIAHACRHQSAFQPAFNHKRNETRDNVCVNDGDGIAWQLKINRQRLCDFGRHDNESCLHRIEFLFNKKGNVIIGFSDNQIDALARGQSQPFIAQQGWFDGLAVLRNNHQFGVLELHIHGAGIGNIQQTQANVRTGIDNNAGLQFAIDGEPVAQTALARCGFQIAEIRINDAIIGKFPVIKNERHIMKTCGRRFVDDQHADKSEFPLPRGFDQGTKPIGACIRRRENHFFRRRIARQQMHRHRRGRATQAKEVKVKIFVHFVEQAKAKFLALPGPQQR